MMSEKIEIDVEQFDKAVSDAYWATLTTVEDACAQAKEKAEKEGLTDEVLRTLFCSMSEAFEAFHDRFIESVYPEYIPSFTGDNDGDDA